MKGPKGNSFHNGHQELIPHPEPAHVRNALICWEISLKARGTLPIFCLKLLKATELILRMKNGLYSFLRLDLKGEYAINFNG